MRQGTVHFRTGRLHIASWPVGVHLASFGADRSQEGGASSNPAHLGLLLGSRGGCSVKTKKNVTKSYDYVGEGSRTQPNEAVIELQSGLQKDGEEDPRRRTADHKGVASETARICVAALDVGSLSAPVRNVVFPQVPRLPPLPPSSATRVNCPLNGG